MLACGAVCLIAAAAIVAYGSLTGTDYAWERCETAEAQSPEQRITDCGAVILAGSQPPKAMAFAYRTRGHAFYDIGEIASAVQDYGKALEIVTDDPTLYAERGFALLRNGLPNEAIADFTTAITLNAQLPEPLVGRGNAYLALGQPEPAAQDFSVALNLKPDLGEAVYRRALANLRMNRIADASADYDRALELAPKNPNYWNARCWFRATMSIDLDLALADCDAALKLKPGFAPALDSRAFVLLRLGRLEDALAAYDAAIAAETRYGWPYFGRGIVKKRLGDVAGADADFAAARERQPDIDQQYANYGEVP
jgi:tetratricopeptide (TPR) repeat protein